MLPALDVPTRDRVADLALAWIDDLGPVIAAGRPPRRWSGSRRREERSRRALETALAGLDLAGQTPPVTATMLAAGIQVPIAAGAWLLVWMAAHGGPAQDPDHVVWETLRLTPPTWITARVATEDVTLGTVRVPRGSLVMISPLLLGRLPSLVPGSDPDRASFDPDRWRTGEVRPGAWLPFGAGPHACPGRTLGLAMLRHLAAWAVDHRLSLPESVAIDQSRGIAPHPSRVVLTAGDPPP